MRTTRSQGSKGFSLLEMVVAMAVLSLCLGVLYQATGGATRNVRTDERYAYAVELSRSLLAGNSSVPPGGLNRRGETPGGFRWRTVTSPVSLGGAALPPDSLHTIEVAVSWNEGGRDRSVVLNSVVPGVSAP